MAGIRSAWNGANGLVFTTRWGDLRHLHATMLLLAGAPVHVVAARLAMLVSGFEPLTVRLQGRFKGCDQLPLC